MLPKKQRLPIQGFYNSKTPNKNLIKQAVKKSSFFIITIKKSNLSFSRFGVSIGSRVYKSAVNRNRIRRQIYNWIKVSSFNNNTSKDVMINVLPKANELDNKTLGIELNKLLL